MKFKYKLYTTVGIIESDIHNDYIKPYVLHREDGPAYIWHDNGSIYHEEWYWCGMKHRHDYTKPATTYNDKQYYYWYGVLCKPEQLLDKDFRDRIQLEQLE